MERHPNSSNLSDRFRNSKALLMLFFFSPNRFIGTEKEGLRDVRYWELRIL